MVISRFVVLFINVYLFVLFLFALFVRCCGLLFCFAFCFVHFVSQIICSMYLLN